jgi:hypothetical protein
VTTCVQTWRSSVVRPCLNGQCNGCELSGSVAVPEGNSCADSHSINGEGADPSGRAG